MSDISSALLVRPEMFDAERVAAAPLVYVDPALVTDPEQTGFDFPAFHDMLRTAGRTDEQIRGNTIHFRHDPPVGDLGLYEPRQHTTNIYVVRCIKAAALVASGAVPTQRGYTPVSSDPTRLIEDITRHETGHFNYHQAHPHRMTLFNAAVAGVALSQLAIFDKLAPYGPLPVLGSFSVLWAGMLTVTYRQPKERPAWRFEERFADRHFLDFDVSHARRLVEA